MAKEIIIKIKPVIRWEKATRNYDKPNKFWGFDLKDYPVFRIEKHTLWILFEYKKLVGSFDKLKNAKACAELLYQG